MIKHVFGKLLTVLGLLVLAFTAWLAFSNRNAPVRLTQFPEEAQEQTQLLAQAVNDGDLAAAGNLIYGQPELNAAPAFENDFQEEIWELYLDSLQWSFSQDCQAADSCLHRGGTVTSLDISALISRVKNRYETLFPRLAEEKGPQHVYNADHSYREAFVMEVLLEALHQVAKRPLPKTQQTVTLRLVYQDAQWWIQPDSALMAVFSGSFSGQEG